MTTATTSTTTTTFLCSACSVSFHTNLQRREHMKSEWHVANVKRRVASLPSITNEQHDAEQERSHAKQPTKRSLPRQSSDDEDEDEEENDSDHPDDSQEENFVNSAKCLFCVREFTTLDGNIAHMETSHGFAIPNIDSLKEGLEPLLWYLDLVINRFYSCLYCGHTKHSTEATRAHMIDKGHCMLDMSPGSEYLDFLADHDPSNDDEISTEDAAGHETHARMLSADEMALHSGKIVFSRKSDTRPHRRDRAPPKDETSLVKIERTDVPRSERTEQTVTNEVQRLSDRDRMGMIGLSNGEQRLILATEKRLRSQQSRKWSARHWTTENLSTSIKRTVFKQNLAGG